MAEKRFECTVSFTYNAENPAAAAQAFIANLAAVPSWYVQVSVRDGSVNRCLVDTLTNDVEVYEGPEEKPLEVYLRQDDIDRLPVEIAEEFENFNANGNAYGVGIYWADSGELVERFYGPSEDAAMGKAQVRALAAGYIEVEIPE